MSTTTSRKPRPKYKALYLDLVKTATTQAVLARRLSAKVRRIQQAIAPHGEYVLHLHALDFPTIQLGPHDYVCVQAQFEQNGMCSMSSCGDDAGFESLNYRGTPIMERDA